MNEDFDDIEILYRLLSEDEWAKFQSDQSYHGSSFDRATGFLHFSMETQVKKIAEKFFGVEGSVIIVKITRSDLDASKLIFEKNTPTGDTYPHYYSSLDFEHTDMIYSGPVRAIAI